MSATLEQLLTEQEKRVFNKPRTFIDGKREVHTLTVLELSEIGLTLMQTEWGDIAPKVIISAEAIRILTQRAIKKNLLIF